MYWLVYSVDSSRLGLVLYGFVALSYTSVPLLRYWFPFADKDEFGGAGGVIIIKTM